MLNNIWNRLVNNVEGAKSCFDELAMAVTMTNERLNDGISALIKSIDKLETKGHSLRAMYDDMWTLVNAQEHKI